MELQFESNRFSCLHPIISEVQTQEQTQEVRLGDAMPDIGRVLASWGQVLIRGKEWHDDEIAVNCAVTVWVLYAPEDGSPAQCAECYIPMTMKWSIPKTETDGKILCQCLLKSVDARTLSGRKLMVRATAAVMAQAYAPWETESFHPATIPEDVQLLKKTYPICTVQELGEKAFMMDEELTLPDNTPMAEKMIHWSLQPEITDQKVMGDKAVFRGNTLLHILYRALDGMVASRDFEIPFSQYTQLDNEYGHQAQVQILPVVTSLELEVGEQGRLRLKAGISGQYMIMDTREVETVEDAYSPDRTVTVKNETVQIPSILQRESRVIRIQQTGSFGSGREGDVVFYPGFARKQRTGDQMELTLPGIFQALYYDGEGVIQASSVHWQESQSVDLGEQAEMDVWCSSAGKPQMTAGEDSTMLRGSVQLDTVTRTMEQIPMVSGLILGELEEKDPMRPSLILQRPGKDDLWTLAKNAGSTVEAIRSANSLTGEPQPEQMLLIPVL